MYLISLDNIDYMVITGFFALLFGIAYKIRDTKLNPYYSLSAILGNIGIIELTAMAMLGAIYGFPALVIILFATIITEFILYSLVWLFLRKPYAYAAISCNNYTIIKISVVVLKVICLSVLSGVTVIITYKLLHALLGWNFAGSIIGVLGFTLICITVGGGRGVYYNRIVELILTYTTLLLVVWLAIYKLGGYNIILHNLHELALKKHLDANHYIQLSLFSRINLILFFAVILYNLFQKWLSSANLLFIGDIGHSAVKPLTRAFSLPLKLISILLIISTGIIAIATPINASNIVSDSSDSQIVTYQAQLSDGQVGYVVQALGGRSNTITAIPGIIPPIIDNRTSVIIPGKYDYFMAFTVMVKYYLNFLPNGFMVLLIILILAMFMYSFSVYVLSAANLLMQNILCNFTKLDNFIKLNPTNTLWMSRGCVIIIALIALLSAAILNKVL